STAAILARASAWLPADSTVNCADVSRRSRPRGQADRGAQVDPDPDAAARTQRAPAGLRGARLGGGLGADAPAVAGAARVLLRAGGRDRPAPPRPARGAARDRGVRQRAHPGTPARGAPPVL